jgi:hypothetical protein
MKINDKYESVLSEYESGILDIEDVINTKEIQEEFSELSTYIDLRKKGYENLRSSVDISEEYFNKTTTGIKKLNALSLKINDILTAQQNKTTADTINFLKNKDDFAQVEITLTRALTNTPDADEEGVTSSFDHTDEEEFSSDLNNWVFSYFQEVDDIDINIEELKRNTSINVDISDENAEDSQVVGWNYQSENTVEENTSWKQENINIKIIIKGEISKSLVKEDFEELIKDIKDNSEHKITDSSIKTNDNKKKNIINKMKNKR